jgi:hypothetical protein
LSIPATIGVAVYLLARKKRLKETRIPLAPQSRLDALELLL